MTKVPVKRYCVFFLLLTCSIVLSAKEMKDTLFSAHGDRIIVSYSQSLSGGQLGLRFNGVQKKLSESNLKKYKKLDEVAVVIFDRTGNYRDLKFDGIATSAFMVPSDIQYTTSSDGYFLLSDNPSLQFTVSSDKSEFSIPIYLAHYEGKRHYKVFAQCGSLKVKAKAAKGSGGGAGEGGQGDVVISSEELIDEGISPVDEAAIRINSLKQMLENATKFPLPEELTHEASMLRELRFKITDEAVTKQINDALAEYDKKKQELEAQSDAGQAAAAAAQAAQAQAAQARQDSIQAAQAEAASKDKKNMMWLIGGIAGLFGLLMGGKQILQTIKNNKMQKMQQMMQQQMMQNIQNMTNQANPLNQMGNPMQGMGGPLEQIGKQVQQTAQSEMQRGVNKQIQQANQGLNNVTKQAQQAVADKMAGKNEPEGPAQQQAAQTSQEPEVTQPGGRVMSEESKAAQQRLREILAGKRGQAPGTETSSTPKISITPGGMSSLNNQIPSKYKRLQKRSGDTSKKS